MRVTNNGNKEKVKKSKTYIYDFPHFFKQYHSAALN